MATKINILFLELLRVITEKNRNITINPYFALFYVTWKYHRVIGTDFEKAWYEKYSPNSRFLDFISAIDVKCS